jgi:NarL family two-component system response regulator LiaR
MPATKRAAIHPHGWRRDLDARPYAHAVTIRLAIVNDYEVVVRGLAAMLRSYADRVEVVELDASTHPDAKVDIALFDTFAQSFRDRERIARLVADPRIGDVVVYTWSSDDPGIDQSHVPGIAAYVSKRLAAGDLVKALEDVHEGRSVRLQDTGRGPLVGGDWPGREEGLTARESEVLSLITQGYSNNDIVETTMLSINSIKSYIRSCYRKIGVTSRSRAILWGIEHGFQPDHSRVSARSSDR